MRILSRIFRLDLFRILYGLRGRDIAGVPGPFWFEEHHVHLPVRDRTVFGASRDDEKFPGGEVDAMDGARGVPVIHPEVTMEDQKHFVLFRVVVPGELALELDEFHLLAVQFTDDLRGPVVLERREFGGQRDFFH